MRVVEMLDETSLGKYHTHIYNVNAIIKRAENLKYFTPFDFDKAQSSIDNAVESLCSAIKDGSLQSGKLFVTREYDNIPIIA